MARNVSPFRIKLEHFLTKLGFGLKAKLVVIFILIKVIPLILLAVIAWSQSWELGEDLRRRTAEISSRAVEALTQTGKIAVDDAVNAIDDRATHEIERTSTDYAMAVANFLYGRDSDIRFLASITPDEHVYSQFAAKKTGRIVKQGKWELTKDGNAWHEVGLPTPSINTSSNEENNHSFHYRPPDPFVYEDKPLYHEITFVDLNGQERIKVVTSDLMDRRMKDVSKRLNTFVKAETYFEELNKLKSGEIYVSEVMGEYVGTHIIGMYTPANAAKLGISFEPEKEAYAGKENPLGRRFRGIVRWAMPVERDGKRIGYVTMALNHDHIMEFMNHPMPTDERYTEIPDAFAGNYAFIWDYKGKSIVHPRHHSIVGFDAATGLPQVPWLEDRIYDDWKASGLPYPDFIKDVPVFQNQSRTKKPAAELTKAGLVGLDCRYLNFAPQCTGWMDLAKDGGSGSLRILWSGLWKLNTAAAIPYYTGRYGLSKLGFGFVAIGAGLDDFHSPATETSRVLGSLIKKTDDELDEYSNDTYQSIAQNLKETAYNLSISTMAMIALVIFIAIWMASVITHSVTRLISGISRFQNGERHFRFEEPIKDELGQLADSFDDMAESLEKSVSGLVAIVDNDLNIRYMNRTLLDMLGKRIEDVVGKPYFDYTIYPSDSLANPLLALKENRDADPYQMPGTHRYMRGKAEILTDKNGNPAGFLIATSDVTSILLEQERLAQQRALLDTIFNNSPDLICFLDPEFRYLAVNPRYASLGGRNPADVVNKKLHDFIPEPMAGEFKLVYELCRDQKSPIYSETKLSFSDGHVEHLDVVRTPVFNDNGKLQGYLCVSRNVSLRVKVENELRGTQMRLEEAVHDAQKASEAKSNFLARMSHEIRTPMNAIIGMTEIVRRKLGNGEVHTNDLVANMSQIARSTNHLLGLINDILDISKIEAGKIDLVMESFDLRILLDNVRSIIMPRCEEKNIVFEITTENLEDETTFEGDTLRIKQVLINLLGNATKFTPECGRIDFVVRRLENEIDKSLLFFSVKDTGIGISEDAQKNIFNPFEQAEGHLARRYGGTGLGLTISSTIVRLMGGDLKVHSQEGMGSDFYFAIWLNKSQDVQTEDDAVRVDVGDFAGKHILLVDDVDINRIILMEMLADFGLVIDEAEDGGGAVEAFEKSPVGAYDIIFMDVQMPGMNGYDATKAIRALDRPDAKTVPIIALTANAFKEDVEMALNSGMNAHLAKPVEMDRVMETLAIYLAPPPRK
ncbi:MAG: PAS domain-containing protein [Desulfovibrio sp.]|jgi:PAS domain S-box-containing protein|nr:PAS domain-containing protein [Desulfovibrio sp.]